MDPAHVTEDTLVSAALKQGEETLKYLERHIHAGELPKSAQTHRIVMTAVINNWRAADHIVIDACSERDAIEAFTVVIESLYLIKLNKFSTITREERPTLKNLVPTAEKPNVPRLEDNIYAKLLAVDDEAYERVVPPDLLRSEQFIVRVASLIDAIPRRDYRMGPPTEQWVLDCYTRRARRFTERHHDALTTQGAALAGHISSHA